MIGLLALCITAIAPSAAAPLQDSALAWARVVAGRARALLTVDAGRLWGVRLDTIPWLFVLEGRAYATAHPAQDGYTTDDLGWWAGPVPAGIAPANTNVDWAGRRWAMVLLPLPADSAAAVRLVIHEAWHVAQPQALPLTPYNETGSGADLLDRPAGRIWLRLEWLALAVALEANGERRRGAWHDALTFRARRYALADSAERARERLLDLAEGMAEYTAWRLTGSDASQMAQALREEAPRQQTYVRTFPYFTGPAYGLLLDAEGPRGWLDSVRGSLDLQAVAARVVGSDFSSRDAERGGAAYGLAGIQAAEDARWRDRERQLAELRARFVDGATLRLRPGALRISFDFRGQVSLGDAGTFMPHLIWRGPGGATLDAPAGGLVTADWGEIRLPLDTLPLVEGPLATDTRWEAAGWTLALPAGWTLKRTGGSWVAMPPPPP